MSTNHSLFEEEEEPKRNRAEALLLNYQPNALPLGRTGCEVMAGRSRLFTSSQSTARDHLGTWEFLLVRADFKFTTLPLESALKGVNYIALEIRNTNTTTKT